MVITHNIRNRGTTSRTRGSQCQRSRAGSNFRLHWVYTLQSMLCCLGYRYLCRYDHVPPVTQPPTEPARVTVCPAQIVAGPAASTVAGVTPLVIVIVQ